MAARFRGTGRPSVRVDTQRRHVADAVVDKLRGIEAGDKNQASDRDVAPATGRRLDEPI